jgi:hypothetical protein
MRRAVSAHAGRTELPKLILAASAAGLLLALAAPAGAQEYRYCLVAPGGYGGAYTSCAFSTFAQCQASAAGDGALCQLNPALSSTPVTGAPEPATSARRSRQPDKR